MKFFLVKINQHGKYSDRNQTHQMLVSYLSSVEFHSKTSRIPKSFRAATLMYDSGKPDDDRGLDTWGTKEISACELRNVMSDLKEPFGTSSSGMNNAFRDAFPIELGKFLHQMVILKKNWACWEERYNQIINE